METLIGAALADGTISEKEKKVLFNKALQLGLNLDEFEVILEARILEYQKAQQSAEVISKSEKYSKARKCPACGSIIPALAAVCYKCGYELSGIEANLTSRHLSDSLLEVDKENAISKESIKKKRIIIESIAIPSTKSDLFEFISSLQVKVDDKDLGVSYKRKLDECILKARTLFANDTDFDAIIRHYEAQKEKKRIKKFISTVCAIFIPICVIGIPIILYTNPKTNNNSCDRAVHAAISKEKYDKAFSLINNYQYNKYNILWSYKSLICAYLSKNDIDSAIKIAKSYYYLEFDTAKDIVYMPLYKYLIQNGLYNEAEKFIPQSFKRPKADDYFKYLEDCIFQMMEKGERQNAISFYHKKKGYFSDINPNDEYSPEKVEKRLFKIIDSQ